MATTIEMLSHRVTLAAAVIAICGTGLAFMDTRHASAMDVQELSDIIQEDRIERIEYSIADSEEIITEILSIPGEEQTREDLRDLNTEINRKDRLLRKLDLLMQEVQK